MTDELSTDTTPEVSTTVADTDSTVEVPAQAGAEQTHKDTTEATHEETFFDPNQVPEELKPAYKQMQADYTRKTQAIAARDKEFEAIRTQADAYKKYEQYVPILEEMLSSKGSTQKESPELVALEQQLKSEGYDQNAIDLMKKSSQFLLNLISQKDQQKVVQEKEQAEVARINSQIDEAVKVDPRLSDKTLAYQTEDGQAVTFGEFVEQLVIANPEWKKDPIAATKLAIKRVDALIGTAKIQGKEELSNSARSKATKFPTNSSSPQGAASDGGATTILEAGREAMKELGIKG